MASLWPRRVGVATRRSTTRQAERSPFFLYRLRDEAAGNRTFEPNFAGGECFLSEALPLGGYSAITTFKGYRTPLEVR